MEMNYLVPTSDRSSDLDFNYSQGVTELCYLRSFLIPSISGHFVPGRLTCLEFFNF